MKKTVFATVLLLLLSACSAPRSNDSIEPTNQANGAISKDVASIKEQLVLAATKKEVQEAFGSSYVEVTTAKNDRKAWRYDLGAEEPYSYEEKMDFVDIEGLKEKRIAGQLFIVWSPEETAESYAVYFLGDNGQLREYTVLAMNRAYNKQGEAPF